MKRILLISSVVLISASVLLGWNDSSRIFGSYVEVRSADVFVGACYANSEISLLGKEGSMAWNIKGGEYMGVPLKGLSVVAAIVGNSTLGDQFSDYKPIRSVVIYDARASERQRQALRAFAQASAGPMLGTIVREEAAPITFEQAECEDSHNAHHGGHGIAACVKVTAGSLLTIQTRNVRESDQVCANAEVFYKPMVRGTLNETAVFAPQMMFRGYGLGRQWNIPDRRGGFVADFQLTPPDRISENE